MWVKFLPGPGDQQFVWTKYLRSQEDQAVRYQNGVKLHKYLWGDDYFPGDVSNYSTPSTVTDGVWHHIAESFDGNNERIFVDGKKILDASPPYGCFDQSGNPCFGSSTGRLYFGWAAANYPDQTSLGADMMVNSIRVSHANRYTSNFTPQRYLGVEAHTLAYWRFDYATTSNFIYDWTGQNRNGIRGGLAADVCDIPQWVSDAPPM